MAITTLNPKLAIQQWDTRFFVDYVRDNLFKPYMGAWNVNGSMPIMTIRELTRAGKVINIPIIRNLNGNGVTGNQRLVGNEEILGQDSSPITIDWNRNGVVIKMPDEHYTEIDLRNAARSALKTWAATRLRDDIINGLWAYDLGSTLKGGLINIGGGISGDGRTPLQKYEAYSEATKDAYLAANSDRFLFGNAVSNNANNDHSAALLNIDTTDDRMTSATVSLAKERAKETANKDNAIKPMRTDSTAGREWYVMFVGSRGFRDLKRDSFIALANRDARPRDVSENPIFQDGDLIYDGVIIREVPEIPVVNGVGAAGSPVAPYFLTGAGAVGVAWGQDLSTHTKNETDYDFEWGVSVREARGVAKIGFGGVQHGMVSGWHSAPASV